MIPSLVDLWPRYHTMMQQCHKLSPLHMPVTGAMPRVQEWEDLMRTCQVWNVLAAVCSCIMILQLKHTPSHAMSSTGIGATIGMAWQSCT